MIDKIRSNWKNVILNSNLQKKKTPRPRYCHVPLCTVPLLFSLLHCARAYPQLAASQAQHHRRPHTFPRTSLCLSQEDPSASACPHERVAFRVRHPLRLRGAYAGAADVQTFSSSLARTASTRSCAGRAARRRRGLLRCSRGGGDDWREDLGTFAC